MKIKEAKYIVSACLTGRSCFYDGTGRNEPVIKELLDKKQAIALCPEELGGLGVPRPACEIFAGTGEDVLDGEAYVFNKEGKEITFNIIKGVKEFLKIAKESKVTKAILKARSPCCGKGKIYDGTFSNKLKDGNGVLTALLLRNDIEVFTDEEFVKDFNKHAKDKKRKNR